jgi:hypothetical protein
MDLYNVVYQLIKNNDCVIIPRFGGFVANYFEAKIDLPNQEFAPPAKKIAFNRELNNNDGLLINHLVLNHKLNWKEAEKNVNDFADNLNSLIKAKKSFRFTFLGEFIIQDNNLIFIPEADQNLLDDSYGLKRFNFPMLKSAKKGIEIQKQPILSKTGEAKINKRKRSLKPLYYTGAVAILAGLLVIAFQFDIIDLKQDSSHESANVLPVELITNDSSSETEAVVVENTSNEETLIEPTTNEDTNENLESENINNIAEPIIEEKAEPIQPITTSLNVHVIAGSFSDITNAENYKQNLNESGFSSQILPAGNGMYRVTVKSFAQKSEAIEELQTLRNSTGNQSLWVLAN